MTTTGISPKAILALVYPTIATVGVTLGSWIVTGDLNESELRVAAAGLLASAIAYIGAYVGHPGKVQ